MYQALKAKTYLGKAHFAQLKKLYSIAGTNPLELREHAGEMLFGDPFMDLSGYFDGFDAGTPRWTPVSGSWSVVTDGSLVYKQATNTGVARSVTGESAWTTAKIQARVKALSFTGTDNLVSLVGRYKDDGNFYQLALRPTKIELRKVVAGAWTTIASAALTLTTGTWYTVKLEATGTTLRGLVNGSQKVSATDSSHATGRAGFGTFNAAAEFDDLTITP
jgi:pectate lyase